MAKYRVEIEADMADIVPEFMKARHEELPRLSAMLAAGDAAGLRKAGHNLAGSGGGYGFDRLTELGKALEAAGISADMAAAAGLIVEIADYVENVEIVYK